MSPGRAPAARWQYSHAATMAVGEGCQARWQTPPLFLRRIHADAILTGTTLRARRAGTARGGCGSPKGAAAGAPASTPAYWETDSTHAQHVLVHGVVARKARDSNVGAAMRRIWIMAVSTPGSVSSRSRLEDEGASEMKRWRILRRWGGVFSKVAAAFDILSAPSSAIDW
ncbi:hypothetical protein PTI98_012328 [Pleurotus ostreatus]|nr:hypothetical protein PTI98_012328 [Pleurotus ostreatus]